MFFTYASAKGVFASCFSKGTAKDVYLILKKKNKN